MEKFFGWEKLFYRRLHFKEVKWPSYSMEIPTIMALFSKIIKVFFDITDMSIKKA
jgi:hypothetical protein